MKPEWVEILITYDPLEAEMVKDLLESGGIPVALRSSKVSPYPVNIGKIGEITIYVKRGDSEAAREALRQIADSAGKRTEWN